MTFYESTIIISESGEVSEQRQTRHVRGKYYKGMRQLFIGQYTVRLNILLAHNVDEFFFENGTVSF
ncbi:MAG: hypothetical protein ACKPKO_54265 [Candidatus Fonsibacter sp.]